MGSNPIASSFINKMFNFLLYMTNSEFSMITIFALIGAGIATLIGYSKLQEKKKIEDKSTDSEKEIKHDLINNSNTETLKQGSDSMNNNTAEPLQVPPSNSSSFISDFLFLSQYALAGAAIGILLYFVYDFFKNSPSPPDNNNNKDTIVNNKDKDAINYIEDQLKELNKNKVREYDDDEETIIGGPNASDLKSTLPLNNNEEKNDSSEPWSAEKSAEFAKLNFEEDYEVIYTVQTQLDSNGRLISYLSNNEISIVEKGDSISKNLPYEKYYESTQYSPHITFFDQDGNILKPREKDEEFEKEFENVFSSMDIQYDSDDSIDSRNNTSLDNNIISFMLYFFCQTISLFCEILVNFFFEN